jgi:murein DD-endopeptidase MepM/ murein hydrolase activator NlpD
MRCVAASPDSSSFDAGTQSTRRIIGLRNAGDRRFMISRRMQHDGQADNTPALDVNSAPEQAVHPFLDSEFRRAFDTLDIKWLAALLLMAAGAIIMLDAVCTSFGSGLWIASAPALLQRAETGNELQRSDRLMPVDRAQAGDIVRTSFEQLADDGHGTKPFTHVIARLAQASHPLHALKGVDRGPGETTPTAPAPAALDRKPAAVTATSAASELPHEIRFGASRPVPPTHASAYAATDEPAPPATTPGVPINVTLIAKATSVVDAERRIIVARTGDTLSSILTALGAGVEDASAIATLLTPRSLFGRNSFAGGETVTVLQEHNRDHARVWQVSLARDGKPERVAALSDDGRYVPAAPHQQPLMAAITPAAVRDVRQNDIVAGASIDSSRPRITLHESLHRLARDNRVAASLIEDIVRLCAQDVDLDGVISARDTAELLYDANEKGEPQLAFAAVTLNGRTHRYYRFTTPDDGGTDYYDVDGHSVTASLMNKPVAEGHLGDGFGWRIHPILGDRRFHEGVDYAAPFGSPIAAAGAGVVEKIDQQWGYGKYVRIRHDFGYETTYAHISGVQRGLKVGTRIHPGQTIAYIGSTGLSTGPHLYYELRVNGHYADPLQTHLRAGRVLDGDLLATFQRARARTDLALQASVQGAGSIR